jgi:dTDP-4-dehydrorhamnose reductase
MKILITGSSGMLAKDIINELANDKGMIIHGADLIENPNPNIHKQHTIDLTSIKKVEELLNYIDPDIIIHTAAIVNLGVCEEDFNLAAKVHIDSSRVLSSHGARMIYISTDSVFDGKEGDYNEESIPDPLNNYARTKLLGENSVKANNPDHVIVRTNILGFNIPLKGSLCEWGIKSFENKENINGFDDVIFNAIYTKQLAQIILKLTTMEHTGTLNVASSDYISKYEFLKYLATKFDISEEGVEKTMSSDINFKIARPLNTTLNITKAKKMFSIPTIYDGIDQLFMDYKNSKVI